MSNSTFGISYGVDDSITNMDEIISVISQFYPAHFILEKTTYRFRDGIKGIEDLPEIFLSVKNNNENRYNEYRYIVQGNHKWTYFHEEETAFIFAKNEEMLVWIKLHL